MKGKLRAIWFPVGVMLLFALGLLLAGCGSGSPTADLQTSPQSSPPPVETVAPIVTDLLSSLQNSPLSTETVAPSVIGLQSSPQNSPLATATPAPALTPDAVQLVVLHTNDNWGATEPCG